MPKKPKFYYILKSFKSLQQWEKLVFSIAIYDILKLEDAGVTLYIIIRFIRFIHLKYIESK